MQYICCIFTGMVDFVLKAASRLAYLILLRYWCFQQPPWSTPEDSSICRSHHAIPPHNHRWRWHRSATTEGNLCRYKPPWTQQRASHLGKKIWMQQCRNQESSYSPFITDWLQTDSEKHKRTLPPFPHTCQTQRYKQICRLRQPIIVLCNDGCYDLVTAEGSELCEVDWSSRSIWWKAFCVL